MDRVWWNHYGKEALANFGGARYSPLVNIAGARRIHSLGSQNSGAGAIVLAVSFGAKRVILLGYDCQHTGGKAHWHSDHPKGLGNAGSVSKWPKQFADIANRFSKIDIVNCTRQTALQCFKRSELEFELCLK
jgi:hypothetical protein